MKYKSNRSIYVQVVAATLLLACTKSAVMAVAFDAVSSSTELLLVLDPQQSTSQVAERLAEAGFPTISRIPGLAPRYAHYRMIQVPSANPQTIAKLQAVNGVMAVRPVLHAPIMKDDPILLNGQVIVKFKPGTPAAQAQAVAAQAQCTIARQMAGLPQVYVLNPIDMNEDPYTIAQSLVASGQVVYSHPSLIFRLQKHQAAGAIEDPFYPFQWHLKNTGQVPGARVGADIKAVDAWNITMGEGAIVAVIDDCLQKDHEDLKDNYITGFDFVDQDTDPSPRYGPILPFFEPRGDFHGTCVAGIIAARANNIGLRGVAPSAGLIGCKIGFGLLFTTDQEIADAFVFAEQNGAMAINNSWGFGGTVLPVVPTASIFLPDLVSDAIHEVATNGRGGLGVLVLFSSGNANIPIDFGNIYASMPTTMAIGATLRDDTLACYSDFGKEQSVVAPGGGSGTSFIFNFFGFGGCFETDIVTTDVMQIPGVYPFDFDGDGQPDPGWPVRGFNPPMKFLNAAFLCVTPFDPFCMPLVPDASIQDFENPNYTHHMNGTSAACPMVTGVAALVYSVSPNMQAVHVRNLIEHTADKVVSVNERFDGVTGHNDRYGHGRVNAFRAVQAAQAGQTWPSPVKEIQNVSTQALVQLFWKLPDWNLDGAADTDVAGVLVVRAIGQLDWSPTDGASYTVGQNVAPGVVVVANNLTESLDQTGLLTGNYQYGLFVRNENNFYSWGRRTQFAAQSPTDVPLAAISPSVTAGVAPLKVHFAGGGIDKNGIVGFHWNFGDGTIANGPAVDHIFTSGGDYLVTLTVTNLGAQTAQATALISVSGAANQLPTASFTSLPRTGNAPLVVLFQAVANDPDGAIATTHWDFGDGTQSSGLTVEHIYVVPGTYAVVFTATDSLGAKATATEVIVVTGSGVTAGATDPPDVLTPATPACAAGTAGAAISTLAVFLAFMGMRRRS